jgi:hypothetical protein
MSDHRLANSSRKLEFIIEGDNAVLSDIINMLINTSRY